MESWSSDCQKRKNLKIELCRSQREGNGHKERVMGERGGNRGGKGAGSRSFGEVRSGVRRSGGLG